MVYYAVIGTNVFISALLSKRADAVTVRVLDAMFEGKIVPLYHKDILAEYDEVLHRSKFHFKEETIQLVINAVKQHGMEVFPQQVAVWEKCRKSKGCGSLEGIFIPDLSQIFKDFGL